jgi:chitodextrinase
MSNSESVKSKVIKVDTTSPTWNTAWAIRFAEFVFTGPGGEMKIGWDGASDTNGVTYRLYYAPDGSFNWNTSPYILVSPTDPGVTYPGVNAQYEYVVSGLIPSTDYTFGVRVQDLNGNATTNTQSLSGCPTSAIDTAPPTTNISLNPATPNGENGWYRTTPSITLTRSETGTTYYSWTSTFGPWTPYTDGVPVNAIEGNNTFYYYSEDEIGNLEQVQNRQMAVDTVSPIDPTLSSTSHTIGEWSTDRFIDISISGASDAVSGVDGYSYTYSYYPITIPDAIKDFEETTTLDTRFVQDAPIWYVHMRTRDNAGNWTSTVHLGPFKIDGTSPPAFDLSAPANNAWVTTRDVLFSWEASPDQTSGLEKYMLYIDGAFNKDVSPTLTSATARLSEGVHTWYIVARDIVGNPRTSTSTRTVRVDSFAPVTSRTVTPLNPTGDNGWYLAYPTISLSATDSSGSGVADVLYHWDSDGDQPYTSGNIQSTEGDHTLHYHATDVASNSESDQTLQIKVDKTLPTDPVVSSPSHTVGTWSNDRMIDISFPGASDSVSGLDGYSFEWSNQPGTIPDVEKDIEENVTALSKWPLSNGTWYFHMKAKDNAGNWTNTVHLGPFYIDSQAPLTGISLSPSSEDGDNGWYRTTPAITLTRNENGTSYYSWVSSSGPWTPYTDGVPENAIEGNNNLYFYSEDLAGNLEQAKSKQIAVDSVNPIDPSVSSLSHVSGAWSNDPTVDITISGASDATSGLDGYSIEWSLQAATIPDTRIELEENTTSTTSPPLIDGSWYFHLRTKDNAGNWASTQHIGPFVIDSTPPTVVAVTPLETASNVPLGTNMIATFDGEMDTATVNNTTFTVQKQSSGQSIAGTISINPAGTVATFDPQNDLETGEVYDVVLTTGLSDVAGNYMAAAKSWSFATRTNSAPVADPGGPYTVDLGTSLVLDGTGSYDADILVGDTISSYQWRIGSSLTPTGASPTLSSGQISILGLGVYQVELTVTDSLGLQSVPVTTNLSIQDLSGPSVPVLSGAARDSFTIELYWSASTDNVGITGYSVYNADTGSLVGTTSALTLQIPGLSQGTTYRYLVRASDAAGNESTSSNTVTTTTPLLQDSVAPTAPKQVSALPLSSSEIELSWNPSNDNIGVTRYVIFDADTNVGIISASQSPWIIQNLSASRTYRFYVKAYDASSNESAASTTVSATTFAAPVQTNIGTNVQVIPSTATTLTFSNITSAGTTSVTSSSTPSQGSPDNFRLLQGGYYNISTTSTYNGPITVTLTYDDSRMQAPNQESRLRMFHWENGNWVDCTVSLDTVNNVITGRVTSLSPFGIGEPGPGGTVTGANRNILTVLSVFSILIGLMMIGLTKPFRLAS